MKIKINIIQTKEAANFKKLAVFYCSLLRIKWINSYGYASLDC